MQEQAPGLRALLSPDAPEPFRAERYYPVLAKVVRQREEDEEMDTTLPVQPQDGCVDLARLQQRRQWIQKLNKDKFANVIVLLQQLAAAARVGTFLDAPPVPRKGAP